MKSFHQILEEKLQPTLENKTRSSHFYSSNDHYFTHFERQYSSFCAKKAGFTSYKIKPKIIKPTPHILNINQKLALDWLKNRGANLSETFSKKELSKVFRQMAFKLHPDYNRDAEAQTAYRILHEYKEILMQLF